MGSLNTFRGVLVALAALAAAVSFALGNVAAGLWLSLGIALHTALWVHLWRTKRADRERVGHLESPLDPPDAASGTDRPGR